MLRVTGVRIAAIDDGESASAAKASAMSAVQAVGGSKQEQLTAGRVGSKAMLFLFVCVCVILGTSRGYSLVLSVSHVPSLPLSLFICRLRRLPRRRRGAAGEGKVGERPPRKRRASGSACIIVLWFGF